jgi:hypothetical protein
MVKPVVTKNGTDVIITREEPLIDPDIILGLIGGMTDVLDLKHSVGFKFRFFKNVQEILSNNESNLIVEAMQGGSVELDIALKSQIFASLLNLATENQILPIPEDLKKLAYAATTVVKKLSFDVEIDSVEKLPKPI